MSADELSTLEQQVRDLRDELMRWQGEAREPAISTRWVRDRLTALLGDS